MSFLSTFFKHEFLRGSSRSSPDLGTTQGESGQATWTSGSEERGVVGPSKAASQLESVELSALPSPSVSKVPSNDIPTPTGESNHIIHASPARTKEHKQLERIQFLTLCWVLLLAGWNDGTSGPLLPRMQAEYRVGHLVVAVVFIANCIGFISGAAANIWLTNRFGFGKTIALGGLFQIFGYAIQSPAPPFPVLCIGYCLNGFGIALQDAQANGYVAALQEDAAAKMGILHAAYGVGALASPLAATQFAQFGLHGVTPEHAMDVRGRWGWSAHFIVSLGIAVINLIALVWVFRLKGQDELLQSIGQAPNDTQEEGKNSYKNIFKTKNVHLLAWFTMIYVGVEVTTGGWIVTYIIEKRGGGPSSGYVSSGFFGGLTVGRVGLLWLNTKVGEYRAIILYSALTLGLELTIWFVPSLIGNAVAVSIIGVLLGPMYPILMNHAGRILPRWLLTGAIGWIAGFGQAGSAVLPFATGALASKFGIGALQPFLVVNICAMIAFWLLVPSKYTRND